MIYEKERNHLYLESGLLELELHEAQNLKLQNSISNFSKNSKKIPWCRQCRILPVCNFSDQNMLYFDFSKKDKLKFCPR
jgi:sulfatase maturation enzyme AslB (radical SAM superfamily)